MRLAVTRSLAPARRRTGLAIACRVVLGGALALGACGDEPPSDLRLVSVASHIVLDPLPPWEVDLSGAPAVVVTRAGTTFTTALTPAGEAAVADAVAFARANWDPTDGCADDIGHPCVETVFRSAGPPVQTFYVSSGATAQAEAFALAVRDQAGTCAPTLVTKDPGCP